MVLIMALSFSAVERLPALSSDLQCVLAFGLDLLLLAVAASYCGYVNPGKRNRATTALILRLSRFVAWSIATVGLE
jgi:hypothetical protein